MFDMNCFDGKIYVFVQGVYVVGIIVLWHYIEWYAFNDKYNLRDTKNMEHPEIEAHRIRNWDENCICKSSMKPSI